MQPRITLCSVCHSQMPAGQSYCKNCRSTLCPHCRELLPQRSRFCPKCGFLCVAEQQIVTPPVRPATSARPQAMPVPRAATGHPQQAAQVPIPQPSLGGAAAQQHRNCPKCGSRIDPELDAAPAAASFMESNTGLCNRRHQRLLYRYHARQRHGHKVLWGNNHRQPITQCLNITVRDIVSLPRPQGSIRIICRQLLCRSLVC